MIVSDAKAAANRANAQASTGPRTRAGKAAIARNAQSHGLYGTSTPDTGEDRAAFDNLYEDLRIRFAPDGVAETALVARLATVMWRLTRVAAAENAIYAAHELDFAPANDDLDDSGAVAVDLPQLWGRAHAAGGIDSAIARINRHEAHLQRMQQRTLDMLMALQGLRDGVDPVTATKVNARAQARSAPAMPDKAKPDPSRPWVTGVPTEEPEEMDTEQFFTAIGPVLAEYNEIVGPENAIHFFRGRLPEGIEDAGPAEGGTVVDEFAKPGDTDR